jgi:hypothetical protein
MALKSVQNAHLTLTSTSMDTNALVTVTQTKSLSAQMILTIVTQSCIVDPTVTIELLTMSKISLLTHWKPVPKTSHSVMYKQSFLKSSTIKMLLLALI